MRVVFWNLDGRARPKGQPTFVKGAAADLGIFVEVTSHHFDAIRKSGAFDWGVFSLDKRPPGPEEGRVRRLGCAIFGGAHNQPVDSFLLDDLPFPERSLVVRTETFSAVAFHAPPGANHGRKKTDSMMGLAQWLRDRSGPILLGMDANAPKTDRWDPAENEWWRKREPALLGCSPEHHLRDVFRTMLRRESPENPPDNPLALSYRRGRGDKRTDCRYDFIYATEEFEPATVWYPYAESVRAGSDHSAVIADVSCRHKLDGVTIQQSL